MTADTTGIELEMADVSGMVAETGMIEESEDMTETDKDLRREGTIESEKIEDAVARQGLAAAHLMFPRNLPPASQLPTAQR